jgi:hypothetical protein
MMIADVVGECHERVREPSRRGRAEGERVGPQGSVDGALERRVRVCVGATRARRIGSVAT